MYILLYSSYALHMYIILNVSAIQFCTSKRSQYVLCAGRGLKPLHGKSHAQLSLETAEPLYDSSSTMDGSM